MQGNTGYACWSVCPQFQSQSHPVLHTPNFKTAKRQSVKIFSSRLHNRTSLAVGDVMVVSSIFHAVYCSARSNVVGVTESDGLVVVLMKNGYIWQDQIAPWAANADLSLMLPNDKVDLHKPEKRRLDESQKQSSCQYLWGCLCTVNIKNIIMYFVELLVKLCIRKMFDFIYLFLSTHEKFVFRIQALMLLHSAVQSITFLVQQQWLYAFRLGINYIIHKKNLSANTQASAHLGIHLFQCQGCCGDSRSDFVLNFQKVE